jgi:hypothetical protein
MGRPPIGKHAMTGAERQARYLARLIGKSGKSSVTKPARSAVPAIAAAVKTIADHCSSLGEAERSAIVRRIERAIAGAIRRKAKR